MTGLAIGAAVNTFRGDLVFGRSQRDTRVIVQDFVFSDKPQATAKCSGPARIGDQLESLQTCRELGLDDFNRRDLGVGLIDIGAGDAVFAAATARAAAEDFILHVTFAGFITASADNDGPAAAAVAHLFMGSDLA